MTDEQQVPEIPAEENFAALFAASLEQETELRKGIMVHGRVVSVSADAVIMDVGAKAEGSITSSEFATIGRELPSVGDELDAMILVETDRDGLILSILAAHRQQLWEEVALAHKEARTVEVTITTEIKGGYRVDMGGLTAFMPRSEADPNPKATSGLVGTRCECAIL
ncbi:MAG: 30S ribosomal protein S1, partial [Mariprofundaceae bacterium]|nr:30S ribosomal protein S1 [Mariprofundaceae bacterium]